MQSVELLKRAWTQAGYPPPVGPLVTMLETVADPVLQAYRAGVEDFIATGWSEAGEDFPFVKGHPRYQALTEAYRRLANAH